MFKAALLTFSLSFIPIILDTLILKVEWLSSLFFVIVVLSIPFMLYGLFCETKEIEKEIEDRVKAFENYIYEHCGNTTLFKDLVIYEAERNNNPIFDKHKIEGPIHIEGRMSGINYICREMKIYDVFQTTKHGTRYVDRFQGTNISFDSKYKLSNCILCSPKFKRMVQYNFGKYGYEKRELKNAFAYEQVVGAADDYHIQDLYKKIERTLMKGLNGWEFAINVCNGRIDIFIVHEPSHENNPAGLISALETFFKN